MKDETIKRLAADMFLIIAAMPDETAGKLAKGILSYICDNEAQENNDPAFAIIKGKLDTIKAENKGLSEKRRAAILARWNATQTTKPGPETNAEEQPKPKRARKTQTAAELAQLEADFMDLWEAYPRKEGRKQAFEAYKKAIAKGTPPETIRDGVKAYLDHIRRNGTPSQYIITGGNFFKSDRWADEWGGILKTGKEPMGAEEYFAQYGLTVTGLNNDGDIIDLDEIAPALLLPTT